MLILLVLLCMGDTLEFEPDSINATLFMKDGKKIEVTDIRVKDLDPWSFSFDTNGKSIRLDLFRIVRITLLEKTRQMEVLFNDGTSILGRVSSFDFTARPLARNDEVFQFQIRDLSRVHFVTGAQLRSCFSGHYEARTPYPYCPVCGNPLNLGPYSEEKEERGNSVLPTHKARIDGRQ